MLRPHFEPFGQPDPGYRAPHKQGTRILMLHGHGQSGRFFYYKSKPLVAALLEMAVERDPGRCSSGIDVFYPNAPLCAGGDPHADTWTWGYGDFQTEKIKDIDQSITKVLNILKAHGPFDGIVGFSTGATVAAIITSLLEDMRRMPACVGHLRVEHPRFQFAVCVTCSNCDVHVFEGTHHVPRRLGQTKAASHFILQQLGWASGASAAHNGHKKYALWPI
ncbi:serine hydrolase-domain-containing protein [Aspergillus keveii]|uniref:Serine hydrolase-domain-containing protein n=1 Tax=Aspergillus keveii TaxID=714993 RepID=A0ABR4FHA0_9EURO